MSVFVSTSDFEEHAAKSLPKNAWDYYKSGAGRQLTLKNNIAAFARYRIRPRCLMDVSKRSMQATILNEKISIPIGIAPTAMHRMAHPDGECATARAAQEQGTIYIMSTLSTSSIEEVARAAPTGIKWFQLYIYTDREVTKNLIRRAENAGFKALVLTVDTPMFGLRLDDIRNEFTLPSHLRLANFNDEKADKILATKTGESGLNNYIHNLFDNKLTWQDVEWLKTITKLPIILKGILTACDAKKAVEIGVAGIIVSNHGARQVDSCIASIEALPEVVEAVNNKVEVYLDGGIRDATDVFKAIALGAKMVFMGRPILWGLSYKGQAGVEDVFRILKRDFDSTIAICGCKSVDEITSRMVVHESKLPKL